MVVSESLGRQIFPLLWRRPPWVRFSHEVGGAEIEELRRAGGFGFMDLHPSSPLHRPTFTTLVGWRLGLPASGRQADGLVEALRSGSAGADCGWVLRPAGAFDRAGPRSTELRMLVGDAAALPLLEHRPDRGVYVYTVTPADQDVRYPLVPTDAASLPPLSNGGFEKWTSSGPVGWHARDTEAVRASGPEGRPAVRVGPGAFTYVWQSLSAPASLRGRTLLLRSKVRSDALGAGRLWIRAAVGADWEDASANAHPGSGRWREQEAVLPVPLRFTGGEIRVVLLHAGAGTTDFADVTLSLR
jgi:hypothetical protein